MIDSIKILCWVENPRDAEWVKSLLEKEFQLHMFVVVQTRQAFLDALNHSSPDLILADMDLPGFDTLDALSLARKQYPLIPFILLTGTTCEEDAIQPLKLGVTDYVLKQNMQRLIPTVFRALSQKEEKQKHLQVEQDLTARENLLATIVNATQDAMITINDKGLVTLFNRAAESMFGISREEILGKPLDPIMPERFRQDHHKYIQSFFATGKPNSAIGSVVELTGLRNHKTEFPMEVSLSVGQQGGSRIVVAVARDITKRKKNEEQLRKALAFSEKQEHEIASLLAAARDIMELNDFEASSRAIFQGCKNNMGVTKGYVFLYRFRDQENTILLLDQEKTFPKLAPGIPAPIQKIHDTVLRQKKPLYDNCLAVNDFLWHADKQILIENLLCVPLMNKDAISGVLGLVNKEGEFTDEDLRLASAFANLASIALANSRNIQSLKESEWLYSSLVDTLPQYVFRKDKMGRFTFASKGFLEDLGLSNEEILGKTDFDLYPHDIALKYTEDDQFVLRTGQMVETVEENWTRNGQCRYVQVVKTPVLDAKHHIAGIQGIFWDITEKKKYQDSIQQAKEEWERTFNSVPDMIAILDNDFTILRSNKAFAQQLGCTSNEIAGCKCYEVFHCRHEPLPRCPFLLLQEDHQEHSIEAYEKSVEKDFLITVSPLFNENHQLIGCVHVSRDITEKKKLQEELLQSQKMDAIGQLAGGVAHDFNNILMVINSYCDFAIHKVDKESPLYEDLKEIHKAGDRAVVLTRQLLAFSRKQMSQPQWINLNMVIQDMGKMIKRLIGEHIELVTCLAPKLDLLYFDPGLIEQIILNLSVNARDAMPHGGKLMIETKQVELNETKQVEGISLPAGKYLQMQVQDTGTGMDDSVRKHIFEPFFTTKERGKGTGLGLATVYGILKHNGGSISVQTRVGQGTTFTIFLPHTDRKDIQDTEQVSRSRNVGGREQILLVEDDEYVRNTIQRVLEKNGYKVLTAVHGFDALQIVNKNNIHLDLILSDVVMPGMSGRELIECLRLKNPNLKFLYMSGYTDDEILRHGIGNEEFPFLHKPVSLEKLLLKVRDILDAESEIQQ